MDRDPECQGAMSLRMSRVLRDIGVTRQMVARRRRTFLIMEKMFQAQASLRNNSNVNYFYFGSQSEGTTTLGMESDVDVLVNQDNQSVIMDWADWEPWKTNFLMLRNDRSPPQHCCLQILRYDCPLPLTSDWGSRGLDVGIDMNGKVLLKNTYLDSNLKQKYHRFFIKQGPSRSSTKGIDRVAAFYCNTTPPECQTLFTRPKRGHWPRPDLLTMARQYGIFLVPQGHAESDHSQLEWRFSTSMIERLLIFDLCIVKIQVYTFLKVLRKSFFKPLVGDRLSTFHFKTALLFTVETYPPEIWQEHNLMQCVIYCLKTLERWFKLRCCPHYTISGVDLFVGKIRKWEFPLLSAVLSDMIENIMDFVSQIEVDKIGDRICDGITVVSTRYQNMRATLMHCVRYNCLFDPYWNMIIHMVYIDEIRNFIIGVRQILPLSPLRVELLHAIRYLYQLYASCSASYYLQRNQPISPTIYRLYEASLDSDLTSNRLKLASMLYCSGQFERAEVVLDNTEGLLHDDVWQWCPCEERKEHKTTERFIQKVFELPFHDVMKSHVACSIIFNSSEKCCMPAFLEYEMHRTIDLYDIQHRHPEGDLWMDIVIIDSIPFLYYLQYLTYRQLRDQNGRLEALQKLIKYVFSESRYCGHFETVLHVLGHCCELENEDDTALACYRTSLICFPHNNAARWHIMRLLRQT